MFGILLGRKFSNKCKHSVKYIKCRIEAIRKKKQVVVRYLKKDVADLLAGGHEANAFGRIDALIVEINQATCYDMIEQYCGCLLDHLSTMCKERECPKEAMEAVATLIFAAARFSDLPELTDLRSAFTKRYGTRLESSIDKEFVEKIQKKSFSKARKLQLMEDIALEFSVNWNSNMFEHQMLNKSAPTLGKAKKHPPAIKENEQQFPMRALEQHQIVKMAAIVLQNAKSDHSDKKVNFKAEYNENEKYKNDSTRGRSEMVQEDVNELDHRPVNASNGRALNPQPPYRKPDANKTPDDTNYLNPTDESNPASHVQTKQGRETARANGIDGDVHDEQRSVVKQTPSSRRRHRSRRTVEEATKDGGYDKEEEIIDRLLVHLSKKGANNETRKTRTKMRGAPKVPVADDARGAAENGVGSRDRAASMHAGRVPWRQPENENPAKWIAQH